MYRSHNLHLKGKGCTQCLLWEDGCFVAQIPFHRCQLNRPFCRSVCSMGENQVRDYLQQLSPYKSMGPSSLHPMCWESWVMSLQGHPLLSLKSYREQGTLITGGKRNHIVPEKAKRTTRRPLSLFLTWKWNSRYFSLHPLPFVLSLGSTIGRVWLCLLYYPCQVFIHFDKIQPPFLSLFFSSLKTHSSSPLPIISVFSPITISLASCWIDSSISTSLSYWGAQQWTQHPHVSAAQSRGEGLPSLHVLATLSDAAQEAFSFRGHKGALMAHGKLGVLQDPQGLFRQGTFQPVCLVPGVIFPSRCKTLYFLSLNSMQFLSAYFCSLSKSSWMAAQPFGI